MSSAVQDLLDILDLEQLEVNLFRGRSPQAGWQRVFGGQVIGQALVAAVRTVDGPAAAFAARLFPAARRSQGADHLRRRPHPRRQELHHPPRHREPARPGDLLHARCRSTCDEPGLDHQAKMPDVPPPENLPSEAEMRAKMLPTMPEPVRRYYERERPIELRPVEFDRYRGKKYPDGRFHHLDPRHRRAAGRSGDPSMRAGLCLRHDAARRRAGAARPHAVRAGIHGARASIMRSGCTGRSAPTTGCSTRRTRPTCTARAASRAA